MTAKRALSESQARRCEEAAHPACRCRCHGAAHGAHRAKGAKDGAPLPVGDCDCTRQIEAGTHRAQCPCPCHPIMRAFFEALPADDPHHLPNAAERRARRRRRRRAEGGQDQPAPIQQPRLL